MSLTSCVHQFVGRSAVIIGGGPSAPWAFVPFFGGNAPRDAVFFSANDHGYKCDLFPRVDYMVACDNIQDRLRESPAPIIGPKNWADIRVFEKPVHSSAMLAAYCAWIMGCAPIVLVGCDCYTRGTYFHDAHAASAGLRKSLGIHLQRWARVGEMAPDGMFRTMGGPLTKIFPQYDPAELVVPFTVKTKHKTKQVRGIRLRFIKGTTYRAQNFAVDDVQEFTRGEAENLIINNLAVPT